MPRFRRLRQQPLTILLFVIIIIVCISAVSYKWLAALMQLQISSSSFSYSSSLYHPHSSDLAFVDRVKSQPSSMLDTTNAVNSNISSPSSLLHATVLPIVTNATTSTKVTKPTNISSSSRKKRRKRRSGGMHTCHCPTDSFNTSTFGPRQSPQQPLDNRDDTFTSPEQVLLRWLHIPKTGTSFISTLWNIITSSSSSSSSSDHDGRYIDLNVHSHSCDNYNTMKYYSMYDFVLMRRYPWEMYGLLTSTTNRRIPTRTTATTIPTTSTAAAAQQQQFSNLSLSFGLVGGTQHQPIGTEILHQQHNNNFTTIIAAFFRYPKERIMSAYYDNRHANGLTSEQYKELYKLSTPPPPTMTTTTMTRAHGSKQQQQQQKQQQQQQQQTFQPCIYHSNNTNTNNSTITTSYTNPLACFANYPGMAGCSARMLSGETCADGIHQHDGMEHITNSLDVVTNKLHFIGLTEEWDESICQFHHLLFGSHTRQQQQQQQWKNRIHHPQQGEFSNVHASPNQHKMYDIETHLHDFEDVADTIIYNAAKLRFEQMVNNSGGRCHRYMTWDEIDNATQMKLTTNEDDDDGKYYGVNNILSSLLPTDEDGYICEPMSCSDLGKQCGEYDDKCGKTVICGMCDPGRTGLPSTWRVKCVNGQCVDYCPPWDDSGLWSLSSSSSSSSSSTNEDRLLLSSPLSSSETMTKKISEILGILQDGKQQFLSPVDAVMVCEIACNKTITHHDEWFVENFINTGLCHCGTTASILSKNLTLHDFSKAHGMAEACNLSKARRYAVLTVNETQPICCPYIDQQVKVPTNWRKLGAVSKFNVEGEYYDHIMLGCGAFVECELVARERGAELAVFDLYNKMCYLARNVFDLKNIYTITKDNAMRYSIDLRK